MKKLEIALVLMLLLPVSPLARAATAQNVEMGSTYQELDREVDRVITEFLDSQVVTERTSAGLLQSTLYSPGGAALGQLRADIATGHAEARLSQSAGHFAELPALPFYTVTTDWASLQLYSLWTDARRVGASGTGVGSPHGGADPALDGRLVLEGDLVRLQSALDSTPGPSRAAAHARFLRQQTQSVTTTFGSIAARTRRADSVRNPKSSSEETFSATYTTYLVDESTGKTLGLARYFEEVGVFSWSFGPISSGYVSSETIPGGWTFDPNMAWANVQSFSFWYFHGERLSQLDVGKSSHLLGESCENAPQTTTLSGQVLTGGLGVKNELGCNGMHWLDDTVFRECCDQHDECYGYDSETNEQTVDDPCRWWSWLFLQGWRCTKCNIEAIWCFITTAAGGGGGGGGGTGGGGGDPCSVSGAGWCPAECFSCTRDTSM